MSLELQISKAETMSQEDRKVALITGITGQDGSYLTELLLDKGYTVSLVNTNFCHYTFLVDGNK